MHGDLKGVSLSPFRDRSPFDVSQSNILISNDTPPRACLADFNFITIPDPVQKLSCSARLEGGTIKFMSPELLVPEEFGKEDALPTPEADIYAFGLVIFQVRDSNRGYRSFLHIISPGPYRRNAIPRDSAIGIGTPRASREASGKTGGRISHRVLRFAVGFHSTLLGW